MVIWLVYCFILGTVIGSFVNLCACRLPEKRSVIFGRSACDICGHRLAFYDLVPVISYLLLKGRCRYCGAKYGSSNLSAEFITGMAFVFCGLQAYLGLKLIFLFFFAAVIILISLIDCRWQIIPDVLSALLAISGMMYSILYLPGGIIDAVLGAVFAFAVMLAVFIVSRGGMGGGDVKLSAAFGLWLGTEAAALFLFLAFVIGGTVSFLLLITGRKKRNEAVAFGPFLCTGAFMALLYPAQLLNYYWNLFNF